MPLWRSFEPTSELGGCIGTAEERTFGVVRCGSMPLADFNSLEDSVTQNADGNVIYTLSRVPYPIASIESDSV